MKEPKIKEYRYKVEDVNEQGIVTIGISNFNTRDSYDDIVRKGAFTKTFAEGGDRIKHVIDHKLAQLFVVGLPLKMYETETHAIVESKLNLEKQISRDLFSDYKFFRDNGKSLEHSFAYQTIKTNPNKDIKGEDIAELKMYEYSTVGLGANANTPLIDLKSYTELPELITELESRLRKCNYSDEKGKYIEKIIIALKGLQEPDLSTLQSIFNEPLNSTPKKTGYEIFEIK
jgi:HK97 family phage prohead protease